VSLQRSGSSEGSPQQPGVQQWSSSNDQHYQREGNRTVAVPLEIAARGGVGGQRAGGSSAYSYMGASEVALSLTHTYTP